MKLKALIVVLVLAVGAATLFTAVAGHGSSVRYMGSVITVRDSVARGGSANKLASVVVTDHILPWEGDEIEAMVVCANPGTKHHIPLGINKYPAFVGETTVDKKDMDAKGHFTAEVESFAPGSEELDPATLCPNARWEVHVIPIEFKAILDEKAVFDDGKVNTLGYEVAHCFVGQDTEIAPGNEYTCELLEVYHNGAPPAS